jgi:hypothetical protein
MMLGPLVAATGWPPSVTVGVGVATGVGTEADGAALWLALVLLLGLSTKVWKSW